MSCHFLLQRIFLTQGLNLGLLHRRQILYYLSHQGMSAISWALGTHVLPSGHARAAPEGSLCCFLHSWRISGFSADIVCGGQRAKGQGSCVSFSGLYALFSGVTLIITASLSLPFLRAWHQRRQMPALFNQTLGGDDLNCFDGTFGSWGFFQ